ncbi:hypothetical protein [Lactococcus allomyrinae]|uniref:Phage protein n=1 Tax=Lactococcus allomyrinae TaxID=2419773 RepID=A0A387BCZ0_9LACT|nr:hypothetical protein [Lactococcus allomyrinae]AYG01693.1 hypothetical protein D7I46_11890 [Lactococcus allomyrinae]
MTLTKEAIQHIQEIAIQPEKRFVEKRGRLFEVDSASGEANEIRRRETSSFTTNTLSSIVAYIKALDYKADKLYLQIKNEREVVLKSTLQDDNTRDQLIYAQAIVPDQNFKRFLSAEQLNIELQSKFKQNEDRDILLQVVGNIKDEAVQNTSDDGISQRVTIKQGVASVAAVKVPNPVSLTPFSTFQDVEQPERLFVFRMREGAQGALFDTDDNSWQLKAIQSIKEYFEWELADVKQEVVILA